MCVLLYVKERKKERRIAFLMSSFCIKNKINYTWDKIKTGRRNIKILTVSDQNLVAFTPVVFKLLYSQSIFSFS